MTGFLKGIDNFGSESIDDTFQRLETLIRALHIPDFNVFATLVQNTTRHILSSYNEDYNIYDDSDTLFFAGHFLNDINRRPDILEFPRYILAIAETISLIESKKQELNNVSIFEEIEEKFKKLMKLFQDAVYYAQYYQKGISYSALCPVTIAYESVKQFKEDIVKMLLASLPEDSKQEASGEEAEHVKVPISELIKKGESQILEFKETLEYDTKENRKNKDVLFSSLKTVAGFLNAKSGTLLIGVDDSGNIKGIERDFSIMKHGNNDRFEQKIRNCLKGRFKPPPIGKVNISFEKFLEGTICRVDVQESTNIIHLDERVYVRDGNTTQELEGQSLTYWFEQRLAINKIAPRGFRQALPEQKTKSSNEQ